ncbi:sulfite dehydrogenase [Methylococcus sp. EFPC2]|uniref:sulfite dehydrogenase n=1 Tax=Methylococcus sp. EFPC2 TaxID=2812648 RepID=UPI00196855DA|nr:sulfite dehydrogenase [Methylococcus sp. EFPC2]QSA95907.1 sulfite dehydrogenase [Methylococcus sp. EFPC2]
MPDTPPPTLTEMPAVAGGGLLDRRLFLKRGMVFGVAALTAETGMADALDRPVWMSRPGQPLSNYGQPSPHEKDVIRWISANAQAPGNGISWTPLHKLAGTITPSGLHFERHHNGVPQIDPAQHRLLVHGLVRKPIFLDPARLHRYPMRSRVCFVECGGNSNAGWHEEPMQALAGNMHGLVSHSEWTGVPLATVLEEAGVKPEARWIIAEGADAAAINASIPLEKALDDALLALYQNGEPIRPENGYPLRLILPGWEGVTQIKWLRRLEVTDRPTMARNETAKYTELQADGKARQFTFHMDAKSLITHPSYGYRLQEPGLYQISGLAWSGRGKIRKVDVSADGGKTWAEAQLQDPILSCAFTRFQIPWHWSGGAQILQSRATDETGYVQPARSDLIAQRGRHGYFHYNAIVSWAVEPDGSVHHVYA